MELAKGLIRNCASRETLASAVGCSIKTLERVVNQKDYRIYASLLYLIIEHGSNMRKKEEATQ